MTPDELQAENDRLRDDNEALRLLNLERQEVINEYDRQQHELVIHRDALQRERDASRAQVEAVRALFPEANDFETLEDGDGNNDILRIVLTNERARTQVAAALDKETYR